MWTTLLTNLLYRFNDWRKTETAVYVDLKGVNNGFYR